MSPHAAEPHDGKSDVRQTDGFDIDVVCPHDAPELPPPSEVRRLCIAAAACLGVRDGHVGVEFVNARRIAALNERHRGIASPTDVLSFPIDGLEEDLGVDRELGDIVICPEHTQDMREAIVHGVLHLLGMDHETDDGEMLALQDEILAREHPQP